MKAKRAVVHSGKYFLITTLFAVVGLGLVAGGALLSKPALETQTPSALVSALVPGIALAAVGVLVYRFGKSWALYKTLTAAHEEALADTFDTQHVKSDIVSVVDERLSDMQTDLQSVNRELRKLREDDAFDFSESSETQSVTSTGTVSSTDTGADDTSPVDGEEASEPADRSP